MTPETIDHTTLSRLVEAGAVRGAHVMGQRGGWAILVKYGMHERPLAAQRSGQVRVFKKFETLVSYLRDIGIAKFDVNAVDYDPAVIKGALRPDRAEAMRRAHAAAEHDAWFREQVEAAIAEADSPASQWLGQDEARQLGESKRKKWRAAAAKAERPN
ncbi:hypothetical protein ABVE12_20870 [Xanthomonas euvesicatoria]|uniref:Prevent host death protein, Phd antitoxin n=1 Tax=Xanthomonas euvesicatoria pv. euvesicatoria TaxID=2753541 RepID=A0ABS8LGG8_XANEU|nr:hypothetical protein [Xanthomonas euvesicatoria]MCC8633426.1 hypothetical protein [Xanthomonas euvesicatoria pv. euvesicatoria]